MTDGPAPGSYTAFMADQRRARRRDLVRDSVIMAVAVVVIAAAGLVRQVPNPQYPVAVDTTDRLEVAWQRIADGEIVLTDDVVEVAPGVRAAKVSDTISVLVARAGVECYVLYLDRRGGRHVRTLPRGRACEPSLAASSPNSGSWDRIGPTVSADAARARWDAILPEPQGTRLWFLPVTLVAAAVFLAAMVRIVIALVTGKPSRATRA